MAGIRARADAVVAAAALLCFAVAPGIVAQPIFGTTYTGDGTFYGPDNTGGTCSYGGLYTQPWTTGIVSGVALDHPLFDNSAGCGFCIAMRGCGSGAGATPVPSDWQYVLVNNLCPECLAGSLDIGRNGDGRWKIEWYPVQCDVGTSTFMYHFQGSNSYYIKMQVANTRVPVKSITLKQSSGDIDMVRSSDNFFLATSGGPFSFPATVTVTSVLGDVVTDTVESMTTVQGKAQFPLSNTYASVDPTGLPPVTATTCGQYTYNSTTPPVNETPPPAKEPVPPTPVVTAPATPVPTPRPVFKSPPVVVPSPPIIKPLPPAVPTPTPVAKAPAFIPPVELPPPVEEAPPAPVLKPPKQLAPPVTIPPLPPAPGCLVLNVTATQPQTSPGQQLSLSGVISNPNAAVVSEVSVACWPSIGTSVKSNHQMSTQMQPINRGENNNFGFPLKASSSGTTFFACIAIGISEGAICTAAPAITSISSCKPGHPCGSTGGASQVSTQSQPTLPTLPTLPPAALPPGPATTGPPSEFPFNPFNPFSEEGQPAASVSNPPSPAASVSIPPSPAAQPPSPAAQPQPWSFPPASFPPTPVAANPPPAPLDTSPPVPTTLENGVPPYTGFMGQFGR